MHGQQMEAPSMRARLTWEGERQEGATIGTKG